MADEPSEGQQPAAPAETNTPPAPDANQPADDDVNALDAEVPETKPLSDQADDVKVSQESKQKGKGLGGKKNKYFAMFAVLLLIGIGVTVYSFMMSQKKPEIATIGNQALSPEALSRIANSDANLGTAAQTLTVQSDTVFSDQVLIRGGLTVANTLQVGAALQAPSLVISGTSNLGETQIRTLQVAETTVLQGATTQKGDLTVSGNSSFSGSMTASQITVTKLILSGNGSLQVPNHISFPGATPGRTVNTAVLGSGGSASISGSDTGGTLSINTGSGPVAGCFAQMTFAQPFPTMPRVIVTPIGAGAGGLDWYVTRTLTGFSICTNNAAPGGAVFSFDYFVAF